MVGAIVVGVVPGSPAFFAGLQDDDVVFKVSGQDVRDADDFARAVGGKKSGDVLKLMVQRNAETLFIALTMP